MPGERVKVGALDRSRINVHEAYEVRDWARRFGVTVEALKAAVVLVGDRADDVRAHLAALHKPT